MVQSADLNIGVAFIYYDETIKIPHKKRCIVVGITEQRDQLAAVYINSEINPADLGSPDLESLHYQVLLTPERQHYLNKDSYVDCSDLIHLFPESLCRNINDNGGKIYGSVSEVDFNEIINRLLNGGSIPQYYLSLYNIG
jgi:hypothetical protein